MFRDWSFSQVVALGIAVAMNVARAALRIGGNPGDHRPCLAAAFFVVLSRFVSKAQAHATSNGWRVFWSVAYVLPACVTIVLLSAK